MFLDGFSTSRKPGSRRRKAPVSAAEAGRRFYDSRCAVRDFDLCLHAPVAVQSGGRDSSEQNRADRADAGRAGRSPLRRRRHDPQRPDRAFAAFRGSDFRVRNPFGQDRRQGRTLPFLGIQGNGLPILRKCGSPHRGLPLRDGNSRRGLCGLQRTAPVRVGTEHPREECVFHGKRPVFRRRQLLRGSRRGPAPPNP